MDDSVLQSILASTQVRNRRPYAPLTEYPGLSAPNSGAGYLLQTQGGSLSFDPEEGAGIREESRDLTMNDLATRPQPQVLQQQYPELSGYLDYRGYFPSWMEEASIMGKR
jgi:hypothetical protein